MKRKKKTEKNQQRRIQKVKTKTEELVKKLDKEKLNNQGGMDKMTGWETLLMPGKLITMYQCHRICATGPSTSW